MQTNKEKRISAGCLCDPVDGDTAVQEEQTVTCPEAYSINCLKSPGGGLNVGLGAPILHEAPKTHYQISFSEGKEKSEDPEINHPGIPNLRPDEDRTRKR